MSHFAGPGDTGVESRRSADPLGDATRLASELDGDVAADPAAAERAVRERVEAGRRALGADESTDADLHLRADEIRAAAAAPPPLTSAEVDHLRQLADDVARAGRIKQRTEARFAETLQAKVAASSGVALHPSAVLAAAKAVTDAEAAVLRAEQNIADLGSEPDPQEPAPEARVTVEHHPIDNPFSLASSSDTFDGPVLTRPDDVFDEVSLERRRSHTRAASMLALFAGGGFLVIGLNGPIFFGVGLAIVGVILGTLEMLRGQRVTTELNSDRADVGDTLANMTTIAPTDTDPVDSDEGVEAAEPEPEPAPEPVAPPAPIGGVGHRRSAWIERRLALDASKDESEERLRVARQRWHQLAGPDADPHNPEAVVRAHDPQLAYSASAVESSPTVRTVAAFHRKAQAKWRVLWASHGRDDSPEPEDLERVLDELLGPHRAAVAEAERLAAAEARGAAEAIVRRPLLLVEPSTWWAPGRLDQLLSSVPPDGRVLILERESSTS